MWHLKNKEQKLSPRKRVDKQLPIIEGLNS